MTKININESVDIPEGIEFSVDNNRLVMKGPKGEVSRGFFDRVISVSKKDNQVIISSKNVTKREKSRSYSYRAHIKNMIKGVTEGHSYDLKILSSHFPMNVSVNNKQIVVKNFLGEKVPRVLKVKEGADVKVDGTLIKVEGISKEITGQVAADIEQLCRISNRDKRIFQDGIYITNKDGKEVK